MLHNLLYSFDLFLQITESYYPYTEKKISRDEMLTIQINYQLRQFQNMCTEEYFNLHTGSQNAGKQPNFEQIDDNRNFSFKPDNAGNQQNDLTGSRVCQKCFGSDFKLDVNERLVPVSFLMTRKVRSVLQPDELR